MIDALRVLFAGTAAPTSSLPSEGDSEGVPDASEDLESMASNSELPIPLLMPLLDSTATDAA